MAQIRSRGEDVEAHPVADAVGGAQVGPERRLTVGSRPHEVDLRQTGNDVWALVFEGYRWHRDEDVVRQKSHQRVEIG
jgi:hypothetical protein